MPPLPLEPCEPPVDLELEPLYSRQIKYDEKTYQENWFQEIETGLVFREINNQWDVVCPPVEH